VLLFITTHYDCLITANTAAAAAASAAAAAGSPRRGVAAVSAERARRSVRPGGGAHAGISGDDR
jgi:hypothetical protein